jgi:hypothetical protein
MGLTGELLETKGLAELFSGQRTPLDLRRLLEENQLVFPSHALSPGEKWTYQKKFNLSNIGALLLKVKAKLASLEGDGIKTAKIESSLDGDEEGKATSFFDVRDKALVKHLSNISGSSEVKPTGAPTPQAEPLQTKFYLKTSIVSAPKGK